MPRQLTTVAALMTAALLGLHGCDAADNDDTLPPSGNPSGTVSTTSTNAPALTDAQVAGVLVAANQGEIAVAQLAVTRASSAAARSFAQTMITVHSKQLLQLQQMVSLRGIGTQDSDDSVQLQQDAQAMITMLSSLTDGSFDAAYLCGQVRMHGDLAQLLQERAGRTFDGALRRAVSTALATSVAHQQLALSLIARSGDAETVCAPFGGTGIVLPAGLGSVDGGVADGGSGSASNGSSGSNNGSSSGNNNGTNGGGTNGNGNGTSTNGNGGGSAGQGWGSGPGSGSGMGGGLAGPNPNSTVLNKFAGQTRHKYQ